MHFHPLADCLPLLPGDELNELAEDIRANGLNHSISTFEGAILDGRNRFLACGVADVAPHFAVFPGTFADASAFIVSENVRRRQLTPGQKAAVAVNLEAVIGERLRTDAKERQQKAGEKHGRGQGKLSPKLDEAIDPNAGRTDSKLAEQTGAGRTYIAEARKIKATHPEKFKEIEKGEKSIAKVKQEIKREDVVERLESVEAQEAKAVEGIFDVIVIDPPWPMQKIERDCAPEQVAFEYPTMTLEEIFEIEVPAAADCHIWVWATQKFLTPALDFIAGAGWKYVCTFVWHKPGGFQPFGLPQYNCEFAIYARKGTPVFVETKAFPVCFNAPRGAHSEKPEEFYDMVRRVTAGRRLDMFNRRQIEGFEGWGKEA